MIWLLPDLLITVLLVILRIPFLILLPSAAYERMWAHRWFCERGLHCWRVDGLDNYCPGCNVNTRTWV